MTDFKFSDANVRTAFAHVVIEAGDDYIYPPAVEGKQCMYRDEHGGCIAGRVVRYLDSNIVLSEGECIDQQEDIHERFTIKQVYALLAAQRIQDQGGAWKYAKSAALTVLET